MKNRYRSMLLRIIFCLMSISAGIGVSAAWAESGVVLSVMAQQQDLSVSEKGSGVYAAFHGDRHLKTDTGLGFGVGFGTLEGNSRLLIELTSVEADNVADVGLYVLGWERFFPLSGHDAIRPFVGASIGLGTFDVARGYAPGTRGDDDSRFIYGVSAGAQYRLNEQLALELRGRYLQTDLNVALESALVGNDIELSVDEATSLSAGVSWQF
jgi:outer membrane protein with beta-barrel domain